MSTAMQLSENSHQGFDGIKTALCLAEMEAKLNPASEMPVCLRRNGIGSRSSSKERDAETGLDFFLARYYSGAQGRSLSPDEFKGGPDDALTGREIAPPGPLPYADIGNPQSLNKYAYVLNNPLRFIDPDGHSDLEYDHSTKTLTLYDKDGKEVGHWTAGHNVDSKAALADGLPNATYNILDTNSAKTHSKDEDSKDWSYGTQGIVRRIFPRRGGGRSVSGTMPMFEKGTCFNFSADTLVQAVATSVLFALERGHKSI
jgi:RHS repeat-associated protein